MRKLLLSLLVIGAMSLSARAQTPLHGLKTGYVAFTYTGEVLPGQMDNFKQLASKVVAAVAAEEPGTLAYEWTLRPDGKTFDVIEIYQNSDAVVAHVKHVLSTFGKDLGQVQKAVQLVVYGSPEPQAKQVLAQFKPVYQAPVDGFTR